MIRYAYRLLIGNVVSTYLQCNPELSALISKTLKLEKRVWLKELTKLEGLLPFAENKDFRAEWAAIKQRNKERLAHYVRTTLGLDIRTDAMYDVQIKVIILIIIRIIQLLMPLSRSVFTSISARL